ncbi:phenylalanine--tRNA ligase subunit alpha [Candidatus Saccharibacteria bacterium]|nr:phenylalanine--tRNA ligase subunit alpha [Candidatus Saccharibacteria bacterium]
MTYSDPKIAKAFELLKKEFKGLKDKPAILRSNTLKDLFSEIPKLPVEKRSAYGKEVNLLKNEVTSWVDEINNELNLPVIDVTAPYDINVPVEKRPQLLSPELGTIHPLTKEIEYISDIAYRMGFNVETSRLIDDDFHMFTSLNFPEDHPARDDYDTFITTDGLIAPAHTSTMQNRMLINYKDNLEKGLPIAVIIPDRVFRNEDLDATHEHTFYQHEGIYVAKNVTVGNLIATLRAFLSEYFQQDLKAKIQPFYFPFTEPSFEFAIERPDSLKKGDTEADQWLELLGCGMIHPNVLKHAGIDSNVYNGFAWGGGVDRLVMMKYGIEDVRHFQSAKLDFLRQFV